MWVLLIPTMCHVLSSCRASFVAKPRTAHSNAKIQLFFQIRSFSNEIITDRWQNRDATDKPTCCACDSGTPNLQTARQRSSCGNRRCGRRTCEAQQYYTKAASDRNNLKDIEINRGYSYANIHSFWEHEEPWIIRRAQIFLNRYSSDFDKITPGVREMVCSWKAPSFEPPTADFQRIDNGDYEEWVNKHYLRVNRYCDVDVQSVLSLKDNVRIKHILDTEEMSSLLESMYDEIFNTFVQTRRKLYAVICAKEMLDTEEMKMIYKNFYSVLDKIAMFIKVYLDLPIEPHKVDFATIWVDKSKKHIQPKILAHTTNLSLLAIYNIKQDIYGSSLINYVIDEQTKDLKRIRNFIEHKFVKISDGEMSYNDYQLTISKEELSLSTIRLAQLVRCAIIYLCNFVMHTEYDKYIRKN